MENKSHAVMAGIFTIGLLAAAIWFGTWLNRDRTQYVPYEIATQLSIPGLNPQAAVRYRGLSVGKVTKISFDPEVPGQVLIRIAIQPDTPITQSTYAALGYQGVTGIAYVELNDDGSKPNLVISTREKIARIIMRPSLLDQIQNQGVVILEQTKALGDRLNRLFTEKNQKIILSAFRDVSNAARKIEHIPKQLEPTLAQLPEMMKNAQKALLAVESVSAKIGALSANANTQTLPQINRLTQEFRTSVQLLNHTLQQLDRQPQSLFFGSTGPAPGPGEEGFVNSGSGK